MAKVISKGTQLQLNIATVLTTIAQVIGFTGPGPEVETWDATGLDSGTGKEHKPTGYVEGGDISGDLMLDPALTTHQALTDLITTPASVGWKIIFADATEWPFNGTLKTFEPTVDMADGLKASFGVKLDGMVVYPT